MNLSEISKLPTEQKTAFLRQASTTCCYYVRPTVLVDFDHDHRLVREEIFGPVLVAIETLKCAIYEYIQYYNVDRIKLGLGGLSSNCSRN
ncbi:hypothetical protein VHAB30_06780 [Variovorax boronicumulans]|nr:hypothetical protein VHAB30_06780 [Variovorax boronicumulans]